MTEPSAATGINIRRRNRKQTGQRIKTDSAFFLRVYVTKEDGTRAKKLIKLADKSEKFKSWDDVEGLIAQELDKVNVQSKSNAATGAMTLPDFVVNHYLPWVEANKAAATAYGYRRLWETRWKPFIGSSILAGLETATVTNVLTNMAKDGRSSPTLSHAKWFLSGYSRTRFPRGS